MYFSDIDHGFCESHGNELPYPEMTNFYSSFFISFIGLLGLYLNFVGKLKSKIISIIYSLFFINGIGAAGFHYTQQKGWGVIDELSMMIAISVGSLYLYSITFRTLKIYFKNYYIHIIFSILCVSYLIFGFTLSLFIDTREYFPLIFLTPCLSLIPPLIYINKIYYINDKTNASLILKRGMSLSILNGIIWNISESLCIYYPFIKYLYLHAFWHIGFSYGMFLICEFCCHFQLYLTRKKKYLIELYYGIPIINYDKYD